MCIIEPMSIFYLLLHRYNIVILILDIVVKFYVV